MQPSETMQTMTSSFLSSTRKHTPQLDNIIFYSGPSSAKVHEIIPTKADDWLDIDTTLAEAQQQEWAVGTERFDSTGVVDVTDEDTQNAIGTGAQTAISVPVQAENVSKPLCTNHSQGGAATTRSLEFRGPLDVGDTPMESMPARASDTVKLDVQCNGRDVNTRAVDRAVDDNARHALWPAFCGDERSGFAPATNERTSPPQFLTMNVPISPLHTTGSSRHSPTVDAAFRDELTTKEDHVQQQHAINKFECSSASPNVLESSPMEEEETSKATLDTVTNAALANGSLCDRAHSHGTNITDAANPEDSDSDVPSMRRRRRMRPDPRDSISPSLPRTRWSSALSAETTPARRGRKRLRRRDAMRKGSPTPEIDNTSTDLTASTLNIREGERWPIQCFAERKIVGSQEMIMIELPALELRTRPSAGPTLLSSGDISQTLPERCAARKSRRRCKFTREEEELLVRLKARREPRLSWREIQRHFPKRSIGSLQVHYSTHLK